ncbi:MAG: hypothetical protein EBS01_01540, partial [Verrucomicrobia bacterium]|nr:hypothetical protein [Verrucomicrobiota bacterium]
MSIRGDLFVDTSIAGNGASYAAYWPGLGYRPLASTELLTSLTNMASTSVNLAPSAVQGFGLATVTTLTLGSGTGVSGYGTGSILTTSNWGILALPGNLGVSGGQISTGGSTMMLYTAGDLTISGYLVNTGAGFNKAGPGTLTLNKPSFTIGTQTVNGGSFVMNGGADNTLVVNPTATGLGLQALTLNAGSVNLNGRNLAVAAFSSTNALPNSAGTVYSASAGTFTSTGGGTFGGVLSGSLSFTRSGNSTTLLTSAQTYAGATTIRGGVLQLRDAGALTASSALTSYFGTLNLDASNYTTYNATNRLPDTMPIALFGGTLILTGAPGMTTAESLGAVTLQPGYSTITSTAGAMGLAPLTISNLIRTTGSVVNFSGTNLGVAALGNSQIFMSTLNGSAVATGAFLGGWAVSGNEFAGYSSTLGVGTMGVATFGNYTQTYVGTGSLNASTGASNAKMTASGSLATGGTILNSLNIVGASTLTFNNASDTLNLISGGLLKSGSSSNIGSVSFPGTITSGGAAAGLNELFVTNVTAGSLLTVYSRIADNGVAGGTTSLVLSGLGSIILAPQANNTYSGATVVNQVTVNTTGALAGVTIIPGTLTMNAASVTMGTSGAIAVNAPINFNGSSSLTLSGTNTLNGLITFNNTGGNTNPTLITTGGTLTLGGNIISINDSLSTFPTISGTLDFNAASRTVTTTGLSPVDLVISAVIQNGTLNKAGSGILTLSGQNTFGGGLNITDGAVVAGASTTVTAGTWVSGALGAGSVTLSSDSSKLIGVSTTVYNPITVSNPSNTLTIGGVSSNNLVLNGSVTFASGTRTIFVESPVVAVTLGAAYGGNSSFTNAGPGILAFSNPANSFSGTLTVSDGVLRPTVANALSLNSQINVGSLGTFDLNGVNAVIGSLVGAGLVGNISGTSATLRVGFDNSNFTFAGRFNANTQNGTSFNLEKIGSGTMTITSAAGTNTITNGILTVSQGSLVMSGGSGSTRFGTYTLNSGGTLLLDNSVSNLNNRLGGVDMAVASRALNINGGALTIVGKSGVETVEGINSGTAGNLTLGSGGGVITLVPNGGSLSFTPLAGVYPASFSSLSLQGGGLYDGSNQMSIRPDVVADTSSTGSGTGFATYSVATGFRPLTAAELASGLYRGVATNSNIGVSASQAFGTATVNSLTFAAPSTLSAAGNAAVLTLTSGGLLVKSGAGASSAFSGGQISTAGIQLYLQQLDAANTFTLGSYLQSTVGLLKAGAGSVSITVPQYFTGTTTVNGGLLSLGTLNALSVLPSSTVPTLLNLAVNGGSFDLNGYSQAVGALTSNNSLGGSGGFITSSVSGGTLTSATGNAGTFGGILAGALSFTRSGSVLTLSSNETFTGATTIRGGGITLKDSGSLSASSGVTNYFGTLTLDDTGLGRVTNRVANGISLVGGNLTYLALESAASVGAVTLAGGSNAGGANTITVTPATSTLVGGTLTLASLVRGGTGATVNFASSGSLGYGGISNPQLLLAGGSALTNGILGGWAVVNGANFATYSNPGVLGGGSAGIMPFYAYTGSLGSTFVQTDNVLLSVGTTVASGTANSLTIGAVTATQSAGTTLVLASGGLLATGAATITGATLTSGTSELFVYTNSGSLTVSSTISGSGVTLVKSGVGNLYLAGANTFTGSTVVNQGTLFLGVANAVPSGALVINNASVTQGVQSSINASSPVVINGGGVLTLTGVNTLNGGITFNNTGGTVTPLLATPGSLTLGADISALNDSFSTTPSITGTLNFGGTTRTITTSGLSPIGLTISAVISNGTLTKAGSGALVLNATNTFSGSLNLTQGTVILNTGTSAGTGTINITDGAKLAASAAITLANALSANSQFIVGNSTASGTLSGTLTFASASPTITIENAFQGTTAISTTLNSPFGGSTMTSFTKNGLGTLILAANNFTPLLSGSANIADGVLQVNQPYALGGTLVTAGGTINISGGALANNIAAAALLLNPVNVTGSSVINTLIANNAMSGISVASTSALTLGFGGGQTANVFGNLALTGAGAKTLFATNNVIISGSLSGSGGVLVKEGIGALSVAGTGSGFSGNITVDQGTLASLSGGTPFGSGAVTVNSAGVLRLAAASNVNGTLTVNSDNIGLGVLGLAYVGAQPTTSFSSTGNFGGVLAIDVVGYRSSIDMSLLGTNVLLGSTQGGNYNATTLGIGTGGVYRLGGGGGALSINAPVLNSGTLVVGAVVGTAPTALINNSGTVILNTANSFGGGTTLNGGAVLQLGNDSALGSGSLTANGGTIQPDAVGLGLLLPARTIANPINFVAGGLASYAADLFVGGATNMNLTGSVNLGTSGSRIINVSSTARRVTLSGVISGNAGLTASGAGYLELANAANSYSGNTSLVAGTVLPLVSGAIPAASKVVFNGGTLGYWDVSGSLSNNVSLLQNALVDVGQNQTLTLSGTIAGAAINAAPATGLTKYGLGTLVLSGSSTYLGSTTLGAGILSVSSDANLGGSGLAFNTTPGAIVFNGGQLLVTDNITTNRVLTATAAGTVYVQAGKTLTLNAATATANTITYAGPGTTILNGGVAGAGAAYSAVSLGATLLTQATSGNPFGPIATINGGVLRVNTNGPGATIAMGTLNFAGGARLQLDAQMGNDIQVSVTTLSRSGLGTLLLVPGSNGSMGNTAASDARFLGSTILGQTPSSTTALSTLNNLTLGSGAGIVSPVILRAASSTDSTADFVSYDPVLGFISGAPASLLNNTFVGAGSGSVIAINTPTAAAAGTTDVFALKTTAGISGGSLRFRSIAGSSTDVGGLVLNGSGMEISSNLLFGDITSGTFRATEALVYTSAVTTGTLSGRISTSNLTKSGNGILVLSGTNIIDGTVSVNAGTIRFASRQSGPLYAQLNLNDLGTLDLGGLNNYVG